MFGPSTTEEPPLAVFELLDRIYQARARQHQGGDDDDGDDDGDDGDGERGG